MGTLPHTDRPLALRAAYHYAERAWAPISIPRGRKEPVTPQWQGLRYSQDELANHFHAGDNVGLLLGAPSNGLCDIDLDALEAVAAAPAFLPPTGRVHGRLSKPDSHHWYVVRDQLTTTKFQFSASGKRPTMLAEARFTGCQTVVPPSIHPSGEAYAWSEKADPAVVTAAVLLRAVAQTAACALLAQFWPGQGSRDDAALALTGWLLRCGWAEADTDHFVTTVARVAHDEEADKRAKAARTATDLAAGRSVYGRPKLAELLVDGEAVVAHVARWLNLGASQATPVIVRDEPWDSPTPLAGAMLPVASLDMNMLPAQLRGFVWDIAERQQAPGDYAAVATLVAAGAVVGRRIGIHPKAKDDWTVTPTTWGGVVAPSGWGKSPSMKAALKPMERLIAQANEELAEARRQYEADKLAAEADRAALVGDLKDAAKERKAERVASLKKDLAALRPPKEPTARRYRTNDPTVEKLAELLIANPAGMLVYRDELMGWLRSLEKQGHETARAFYNEGWGGTATNYEVDRISRGSIIVPALCLSVLGGIQPGPLRSYVYGATDAASVEADGLLQRFQLLVWPDAHPAFKVVDRWPAKEARDAAYAVFDRLARLTPAAYRASCDDASDPTAIPTLRFSAEAQDIFYEWWQALETRVRSGDLPDAFASHLAKYRSLMPALALLFHLIDNDPAESSESSSVGFVGEVATLQAIAWCEYLESHARRVYACAVSPSVERASALLKRAKRGDVRDGCSVRDIYIHGWERLQTFEETEDALQTLERHGWVRVEKCEPSAKGGRPSTTVHLHPSLRSRQEVEG